MIPVRAVFVSDLHMGFRHACVPASPAMLRQYDMEYLYLVGDILDGWRLACHWHWDDRCSELVDHILGLADSGVKIVYTPGNHDDFLRDSLPAIAGVEVRDEAIHTGLSGWRVFVTHSDLFDDVEKRFHGISRLGSRIYDGMMKVNSITNRILGTVGIGELNYCFGIKRLSKSLVGSASQIPGAVARRATELDCQGAIFGHLHRPFLRTAGPVTLINTGDWVEHQSVVIEAMDGSFRLYDRQRLCKDFRPPSG